MRNLVRALPPASRPALATLDLFAVTAPGIEPLAAAELAALGIEARAEPGGAAFTGGTREIYLANLWLRTASRVLARAGTFRARALGELERRAKAQPWERFLAPGGGVRLRVTCRKSRLYHSDAVAERLAGAIDARLGGSGGLGRVTRAAGEGGEEEDAPDESGAPLVVARVFHDVCTVSVDTSGALLHRRGYRLATAKAPMRETLAAAALVASGWTGDAPLLDPMCGSGTVVVEGALIARRIAPGLARRFAFERWPDFDAALWRALVDEARSRVLPAAPAPIAGSDRDAGAIGAAAANAERAAVSADIAFRVAPISAIAPPPHPGWLVTNPPYGARVGEVDRLRNLYAQLGNVARRALPGWTLALVSANPALDRHVGIPLTPVLRTTNGGIPVRVVTGYVAER
jgi:putative N6-adenine-specific DNA methylase